jgi:ribonuclease E
MKKEMLINVLQPEECRIAILEDGVLEELYVERTSQESYVGNIYKGRIVNIEPSIQAAFVDFGIGRNGFLHVSDVDPAYYRHLETRGEGRGERGDRPERGGRRDREERGERRGGRGRGGRPAEPEYEAPRERAPEPEGGFGEGLATFEDEAANLTVLPPAERIVVPPPRQTRPPEPPARAREPEPEPDEAEAFGAGLIEEIIAEVEVVPEAAEESAEAPKPARGRGARAAKSEAAAEGSEAKPRRRRGGRRRRAEGEEGAEAPDAEGAAENGEGAPAPEAPEPPAAKEEKDRPRYMDSAERRTEGEEPELTGFGEPPAESAFGEGIQPLPSPAESLAEEADLARQEIPAEDDPGLDTNFAEPSDEEEARFADFDEAGGEGRPPRRGRGRRREREGREGRGGREGRRGPAGRDGGRPKPLIQDIFKRGQEVLIQVIKEGIGTKGPTLSTYISIAGRYLVLMPGLNRIGVSRKIVDEEQRARLKSILSELKPPKGLGFIIRTAGVDRSKEELQNDLAYLLRLWQVVVGRIRRSRTPDEIYRESDMITRTIRDTFTADIDTIWVDEPAAYEHAKEFLQMAMPAYADRIKLYSDAEPLFYKYRIEDEIGRIQQKKIPLPMGGSIVIEQTEALVAIDVNSGNFRADNNAEETAYQMNLQAAKEIARQLRLRDLGGVIVNDFIDMRDEKHRRGVEKAMRDAVKRDRARTKVLKISQFGLIEMTRQRIRPSLKKSIYHDCPSCNGTGQVKTAESLSIEVMRMLQLAAHRPNVSRVEVRVPLEVATYLLNRKRGEIAKLEGEGEMQVTVQGQSGVPPETLQFACYDNNGNEVRFLPAEPAGRPAPSYRERHHDRHNDRGPRDRGERNNDRYGERGVYREM